MKRIISNFIVILLLFISVSSVDRSLSIANNHMTNSSSIIVKDDLPEFIDSNLSKLNQHSSTNFDAQYQSNLDPNSAISDENEVMGNQHGWRGSPDEVAKNQKDIIPRPENFIPVSSGSEFHYYVGSQEFNPNYGDTNSPVIKMIDDTIEYVLKINSNFELGSFKSIKTIGEIKIVKFVPRLNAYVINIPLGDIDELIDKIQSLDGFEYLEPHLYRSLNLVPDDPRWMDQWGPQLIGMESAWDYNIGNRSVIVAVIDTGIDYTHPELSDAYMAKGYDWYNDDNDPFDDHYHGTHVSGTIAAAIDNGNGVAGIANVSIFGEKIFGGDGSFAGDIDAAAAIDHAVAQGADILSNSWGGVGYSLLLADAVANAIRNGTMVIAAAGNSGTNTLLYPAAYPGVIAVSATNSADNLATFSTYGDWIDIAAPGVDILSTYPIASGSYNTISGTSMATPHVSGLLALIMSQFPDYTLTQVEQLLYLSADDIGDSGFDASFGNGRINASRAMLGLPEHEIAVTLVVPSMVKQSSNVTISVTIQNKGIQDETNVNLDFYLENIIVNSTTISNLSSGSSYTLTYEWYADTLGTYNVTAYSPLITGELYTDNNLRTESVEVSDTKLIGIVTAHAETYPTAIVDFYTGAGYIVLDVPTLYDFSSYDLIIVTEGGSTWPVSDLTILNNYLRNGGHVAAFGDSGLNSLSWISDYGLSFTNIPASIGYTTYIEDHFLTHGVLEMYAGSPVNSLSFTDGNSVVNDSSNNYSIVGLSNTVNLIVYTDDMRSYISYADNQQFLLNLLNWAPIEYDTSVSLTTPTDPKPNSTYSMEASITNNGQYIETNIELHLELETELVSSTVINILQPGETVVIYYSWTPTNFGTYNFTVYSPAGNNDSYVDNNVLTVLLQSVDFSNYIETYPLFTWYDAASIGYEIGISGDDTYSYVDFPFQFTYYDQIFSRVYISSNGWLSFVHSKPGTYLNPIFPTSDYSYVIAPLWDDLVANNNVYTYGTSDYLVIEYIDYYSISGALYGTFAVVFFKEGDMLFLYKDIQTHESPTVGLNYGRNLNFYNSYTGNIAGMSNFAIGYNYITPTYDISVSLTTPTNLEPNNTYTIEASATNNGQYIETNIELHLELETELVSSTVINILQPGETVVIYYSWTPTNFGTYNFTVYSPVGNNDSDVDNNYAQQLVEVMHKEVIFGYIDVRVYDNYSSAAISNALIEVYNDTGGLIDTGYTDATGFYNVTGLDVGWYDLIISASGYQTLVTSNFINWIGDDDYINVYLDPVADGTLPVIDSPKDIVYTEGETGYQITWSVSDDHPGNYELLQDGVMVEWGAWGDPSITINVDGLSYGQYSYTLVIYDESLNEASDTVIVAVLDGTLPVIDSPTDIVYTEGETGYQITWSVSDDHPGNYELLQDGVMVEIGVWNDPTITVTVDGLSYGQYSYTLVIHDESLNEASDTVIVTVSDGSNPVIDSPPDLEFIEGEFGHQITWSVNDDHPGTYELLQDGVVVEWGVWSDASISITLDGLSYGQYTYTLVVYDESLNQASDSVNVTIHDGTNPIIDSPPDLEFNEGKNGHRIRWNVDDDNPSNYELLRDGNIIVSRSWHNRKISINLNGLRYGQYNYTLVVYDESFNQASDSVIVTVHDATLPVIDSSPDLEFTEGETGHQIIWNVNDNHPGSYELIKDDERLLWGAWDDPIISILVDGLSYGQYTYTLIIYDESLNDARNTVIVTILDGTNPIITQNQADITYTEDDSNNIMTWVAEDDHPKTYQITLVDIIIASGSWTSQIPVTINVDHQPAGTYVYFIVFFDENDNRAQESVILIVTPNPTSSSTSTMTTTTTITSSKSSMVTTSPPIAETTDTLANSTPDEPIIMLGSVFLLSSIISIVILIRRKK